MREIAEKFRRNLMNFLFSCYIFNAIDHSNLHQYLHYFYKDKICSKRNLFTEGEMVKEVIFIKKGVFELSKMISLSELDKMISNYIKSEDDLWNFDMMELENKYSK